MTYVKRVVVDSCSREKVWRGRPWSRTGENNNRNRVSLLKEVSEERLVLGGFYLVITPENVGIAISLLKEVST